MSLNCFSTYHRTYHDFQHFIFFGMIVGKPKQHFITKTTMNLLENISLNYQNLRENIFA